MPRFLTAMHTVRSEPNKGAQINSHSLLPLSASWFLFPFAFPHYSFFKNIKMSLGYHCKTERSSKVVTASRTGNQAQISFVFIYNWWGNLAGGGDKLRISQAHGSNRTPVFRVCPIIDCHPFLGSDSAKHLSDKDMYQGQPHSQATDSTAVDKGIILWVRDKTVSNSLLAGPECFIY